METLDTEARAEAFLRAMLSRLTQAGWRGGQYDQIVIDGETVDTTKPADWRGRKPKFNFQGLLILAADDAGFSLPLRHRPADDAAARLAVSRMQRHRGCDSMSAGRFAWEVDREHLTKRQVIAMVTAALDGDERKQPLDDRPAAMAA